MNAACKVVDNACTFFLGYRLKLLSNGCLQCSNGAWVAQVHAVFKEHPEKKICGVLVRWVWCPFHFIFAADKTLPELFTEPCYITINCLMGGGHHPVGITIPSHQGFRAPWTPPPEQPRHRNVMMRYSDHLMVPCHARLWMQRVSNDSVRVPASSK